MTDCVRVLEFERGAAPENQGMLLSVEKAKTHIRATKGDDFEDEYIMDLVNVVTQEVEDILNRTLIQSPWTMHYAAKDSELNKGTSFRLPKPPIRDIMSIRYDDEDGEEQTVDGAHYRLAKGGYLQVTKTWPRIPSLGRPYTSNFSIVLNAGYGLTASSVPNPIKHAALMILAHRHEHRQDVTQYQRFTIPFGARRLLAPYKVWSLA